MSLSQKSYPIRIELPFVQGSRVNVYLLREPKPLLIDAGYNSPDCWTALQAGLAAQGLQASDLEGVIVTHPHIDHYGLAAKIAQAGKAKVWMCETGVEWLTDFPAVYQKRVDYHRAILLPGLGISEAGQAGFMHWMDMAMRNWEEIPAGRIHSFAKDALLPLNGLPWQVIHTPGHDATIVVFHQLESKQLIGSDALLIPTATPVVETPPLGQPRQPSLPQMLVSMRKLAELEIETIYPGHGAPFTDPRTVVESQLRRIQQRKEECYRHVANGVSTVAGLFQKMYGAPATVMGMAGLWMALGYVDLLIEEERIVLHDEDGLWRLTVV